MFIRVGVVVLFICGPLSAVEFQQASDRYYAAGFEARQAGDTERARREWEKFLTAYRWEGGRGTSKRVEEVKAYLKSTEPSPRAMPVTSTEKLSPDPVTKARSRRRKRAVGPVPVGGRGSRASQKSMESRSSELARRAEAARRMGQLESAAQLYRLGLKLEPTSKVLQAGLSEVEAEIR